MYDTKYKHALQSEYAIYTGYSEQDEILTVDEETYRFFKQTLTQTPESEVFNHELITDFESFKAAYGTGHMSMLVRLEDSKHVEIVRQELAEIFPAYCFTSQYDIRHGDLSHIYDKLVRTLIIGSVIIALIMGLIIAFLNKDQFNQRNKELAILYSLGYKRGEILAIIFLENSLLFSVYLVIASLAVSVLNRVWFSRTKYYYLFISLFEPTNILSILTFIFLIMLVSIIWSLNGVKEKNLISYLNES